MKRMEWSVVVKGKTWRNEFSARNRDHARQIMANQKAVFEGTDAANEVDVHIYQVKDYVPVSGAVVRFYTEKR